MLNRAFGSPNHQQREGLLLTSACLLKLSAGQGVAGPVYANFMRSAFGLKQSELDVAMALQSSGSVLMLVSGLLYDRCGPRVTVAVGGVASTLASLAVTLAFAFPEPLRGRAWSLWLLMFLHGHALNYAEVAATAAAMSGFPSGRRGRVMAAVDSCYSLGAPLSALVHFLILGNIRLPPDRQNAVGAMAVQTVLTAAVHAFALAIVHQPALRGGSRVVLGVELGERTPILTGPGGGGGDGGGESDDGSEAEEAAGGQRRGETAAEFLRAVLTGCLTAPFLLLLAAVALSIAQSLAVYLNVTTVTRSLGLSAADAAFFWVPTVLAILWRCALGPLSDRFLPAPHHRAALLFACLAGLGSPALLLITVPMHLGASPLGVTLSSYTLSGLLTASLFTLTPVLLSQTSSQNQFARLYSVCIAVGTALSLPLGLQFGLLYDQRAALVNGTVTCVGQACYTYGNIANSACHLLSMACLLGLAALLHSRSRGN